MKTIVVLGAAAVGLMWFASKRRAQAQAQAALPAGTTTAQATSPSVGAVKLGPSTSGDPYDMNVVGAGRGVGETLSNDRQGAYFRIRRK
ncbi:MAG: hypothetical protein Q8R28_01255 [Dehalococcoidia bacterium]|nr:hypothetical protein [Dehalococcoidia bacterium]